MTNVSRNTTLCTKLRRTTTQASCIISRGKYLPVMISQSTDVFINSHLARVHQDEFFILLSQCIILGLKISNLLLRLRTFNFQLTLGLTQLQHCKSSYSTLNEAFSNRCGFLKPRFYLNVKRLKVAYSSLWKPIAKLPNVTCHLPILTFTWRHQSRDHLTRGGRLSMGGQLWPCVYLAPLQRYGASNILGSRPWPFVVTWRHQSRDHSTRHMWFPIGDPL